MPLQSRLCCHQKSASFLVTIASVVLPHDPAPGTIIVCIQEANGDVPRHPGAVAFLKPFVSCGVIVMFSKEKSANHESLSVRRLWHRQEHPTKVQSTQQRRSSEASTETQMTKAEVVDSYS